MNTQKLPCAVGLVGALVLTACGGGGDGGAVPPADPTPLSGPVATDLQAKTLAARSIDALFAYDNMNSEAIGAALAPLPVVQALATPRALAQQARQRPLITGDDGPGGGGGGPVLGSGAYPVACAAGTGTTTFSDADVNHHVTAGDHAILAASACQQNAAFPWALSGSVRVDVVGGTNIEQHLYFVSTGSAQLRVTHAGTSIGGNRTATGVYTITVSNTADGAPPDQDIAVKDMTIAHPDVSLRMVGLSYKVVGSSNIAAAAGRFDTSVAGIGNVQLSLGVKNALTVDSATTRFRPSAGAVTLLGTDFSFDVEYGTGGAVTIRVDNGRDGTVDRTVTTTVAELDSLLTVK